MANEHSFQQQKENYESKIAELMLEIEKLKRDLENTIEVCAELEFKLTK